MNTIYYNNTDLFSDICHTPYVSYSYETDGKIYGSTNLVLNGVIAANCKTGFNSLIEKQNLLINRLNDNYKNFQIKQDGSGIFNADYAYIKKIDFEDSPYGYLLPFEIEINCYDNYSFSGAYYILDPVNSFTITEDNANNLITLKHKVQAKAIGSSALSIENAKNWVYSQSGMKNFVSPALLNISKPQNFILKSFQENIDRFNSTYSIDESYVYDKNRDTNSSILRYTSDVNISKNDYNTVSLRGSIIGGLASTMENIRQEYKQLNLYTLAADAYFITTSMNDLSVFCVSSGVDENHTENSINFDIVFNNNNTNIVNVNSTSSFEEGLSFEATEMKASLKSTISCRVGSQQERLSRSLDYYKNTFNNRSEFLKNISSIIDFNSILSWFRLQDEEVDIDEKDGIITYSCSWLVHKSYSQLPSYIKRYDLRLVEDGSRQVYNFAQPLCNDWVAYKSYMSKKTCSINGKIEIYDKENSVPDFYKTIVNQRIPSRIIREDSIELANKEKNIYNISYKIEEF